MNTDSIRRRTTTTAVVRSSAKTVSGGWCAKSFPDGRTSESITWRLKMTTAMWQPELPFTTVSPSVSPVREKDSQELPDSCSNTFERYVNSVHVGLSGRTSQERSQASGGGLPPAPVRDGCARVWSGMASVGCAVFRRGPKTRACVPCWKSWNHALRGSTF